MGIIVVVPADRGSGAYGITAIARVANRAIVAHAIDGLRQAGIREIAIVGPTIELAAVREGLGHAETDGLGVTFLPQARGDMLGAIAATRRFTARRPAVVHLGNGLLGQRLDAVMAQRAGTEPPDLLLLLHRSDASRNGLPQSMQRLLGLTEINGPGSRLALADVCLFGPGALDHAASLSPGGRDASLIEIAENLAERGHSVEADLVRGWRRYDGDPADLLELNRLVLDQQPVGQEPIDAGDNRIEGRVIIHPTAQLHSSIILGPCIIGAHAHVESSYIGPYTSIGAGAVIEGAEIVRSIVAEDARIRHVGGRIEASTIGRHANIFRDFALPRAMRLHVGEGVEVALS